MSNLQSLFPLHVESDRLRYEPLHDSVGALDRYAYHRSGEMDAVLRSLGERPHATSTCTPFCSHSDATP